MVRKKDLQENINRLENSVNNLYEMIRRLEKNQNLEIGEGEKPKTGWWYLDISNDGLVYTKTTIKDVLIALLKHLKLNLVKIKDNKPFEIRPKEDGRATNNIDDLLETDGVITVSITGGCLGRKSTFIRQILQTEFSGHVVVEINEPDHLIRYAKVKSAMPLGRKLAIKKGGKSV